MTIDTIADFRKAMRNGPYAWPGGYPCYFVMADGEPMSFDGAKQRRREMLAALAAKAGKGNWPDWGEYDLPVAVEVNWEDASLVCCQTGQRIPSAYAEPE
jgi:hypothetical protein